MRPQLPDRASYILHGDSEAAGSLQYRQISNIRHTKSQNCFSSHFEVVFAQSIGARCQVKNEDVVGAAPTGGALTTSEWSTIWLPIKVHLILKVWQ